MAAGLARKAGLIEPVRGTPQGSATSLRTLLGKLTGDPAHDSDVRAHGRPMRVPLGIPDIDRALDPSGKTGASQGDPKGIIANGLHEVRAETGLAAGTGAGFALALGLTMARGKSKATDEQVQALPDLPPVFWIADRYTHTEYGRFYGPGLSVFGLTPGDLIRIHPESREETLWAAGEIAATPGAAAFCLIEICKHPREMDLTTTRRLLMRAQASGTPVIVLRQSGGQEASAALTRWCVHPAPSSNLSAKFSPEPLSRQFIGPPAFDVSLEKCRGGIANPETTHSSTRWTLEWNPDDQRLAPTPDIAPDPSVQKRPKDLCNADATARGHGGASIHPINGQPGSGKPFEANTLCRRPSQSAALSGSTSAEAGERPHPAQETGR